MSASPAPSILAVAEVLKLTDMGLRPQVYRASTTSIPSADFLAVLAALGPGDASGASTQASTPRTRSASTVSGGVSSGPFPDTVLTTVSLAARKPLSSRQIPAEGVIMHPSNPAVVVTRSGGRVTATNVESGETVASLALNEAKQGALRYFRFVNSEVVLLVTSKHLYTWSVVTSSLSEVSNLGQSIFKGASSTVVTSCSCIIIPDNSYYAVSAFVGDSRSRQELPSTLIVSEAKGNFILPDTSLNSISMMPTPSGDVTYALAVVKLGESGGLTIVIKDLLYSLTKGKKGLTALPPGGAGSGEKTVTVGRGAVDIPMTLLAVPELCLLFLSAKSGRLYCVDMFNGVELESVQLPSPMIGGAARRDGSFVALCQDGSVFDVRISLSGLLKTPKLSKEQIFGVASACSFYKDTYPDSFDAVSGLAESVLLGFFELHKYLDASKLICAMGPVLRTPDTVARFPDAQAMNIYCSTLFSTRQRLKSFEALRLLQCCAAQGPEQLKMFDTYLSRDYIQLEPGDTSLAAAVRSITHNEVLALKAQQLAGSHTDTVKYLLQNGGVPGALAYCERVFDEQGTHCFRWLDVIEGASAGALPAPVSEDDLDRILASRGCDDGTLSTLLLRDVLPANYKKAMDLISSVMRSDRRRLTPRLQTLFVVCTIRGVRHAAIPPEAVKTLLLKHVRPDSPLHDFDRTEALNECRVAHMDDLALLLCLEASSFRWQSDWALVNVDSNWFEDSIAGISIRAGTEAACLEIVSQLLAALGSASSPQARLAVAVVASTLVATKKMSLPAFLSVLAGEPVDEMTPSARTVAALCSSSVSADLALETARRCTLDSKRLYEVLLQLYFRLVLYRDHAAPAVRTAGIKQLLEFLTGAVFSGALGTAEIVAKAGEAFRETVAGAPGPEGERDAREARDANSPSPLPQPLSGDDCFAKLCSTVFYLVVTSVLNKKVPSTTELFHFVIRQIYLCASDTETCGQRFGRGFCEYFGSRDPEAPVRSPLQRTGNVGAMAAALQTCVLLAGAPSSPGDSEKDAQEAPGSSGRPSDLPDSFALASLPSAPSKPTFLKTAAAVISADAARVYPWEQSLGLLQAGLQWSTLASLLAAESAAGAGSLGSSAAGTPAPAAAAPELPSAQSKEARLAQAGVLQAMMEAAAGASPDSRVKASSGQIAAFLSALSGLGESLPDVEVPEGVHPLQRGLLTSFLQNVLALLPPSPQRFTVEQSVFRTLAAQKDIGMMLAMFLRLETNDAQVHAALAQLCLEKGDDKLWIELLGHRYGLDAEAPEKAEEEAISGVVGAAISLFPPAEIYNVVCFCRAYLTWRQQASALASSSAPAWLAGLTRRIRDAAVEYIGALSSGPRPDSAAPQDGPASPSPLSPPGINMAQLQFLAVRLDTELGDYDAMETHVERFTGLDCERLLRDLGLVQDLRKSGRLPLLALIHYRCAHYKDAVGTFLSEGADPQERLAACVSFVKAHDHPLLWNELVSRSLEAGKIEQALELAAKNSVQSLYPGLRRATFSALEGLSEPAAKGRLVSLFGLFVEALISSAAAGSVPETLPLDRAFCKGLSLELGGEPDEEKYVAVVGELVQASPRLLAELSQNFFNAKLFISASVAYAALGDYGMLTHCYIERKDLSRALACAALCNDRGAWTSVFKASVSALPGSEVLGGGDRASRLLKGALVVSALNLLHTPEEASFVSEALRESRLEESLLIFQTACVADGLEALVESNKARLDGLRGGEGAAPGGSDVVSKVRDHLEEHLAGRPSGVPGAPEVAESSNPELREAHGSHESPALSAVEEKTPYAQFIFSPCCQTVFTTYVLLVAALRPSRCADTLREYRGKIDFQAVELVIREKRLRKSHSFCLLALGRPDEALSVVIAAYSPEGQDTEENPFSPARFLKLLAQAREKPTCVSALRLAASIALSEHARRSDREAESGSGSGDASPGVAEPAALALLDAAIRIVDEHGAHEARESLAASLAPAAPGALPSISPADAVTETEEKPEKPGERGVHTNATTEATALPDASALPRPPAEALLTSREILGLCPRGEGRKDILFGIYVKRHVEGAVDDLALNTAYVEHMVAEAEADPEVKTESGAGAGPRENQESQERPEPPARSPVECIARVLREKHQLALQEIGDSLFTSGKRELRELGCAAYMRIIEPACQKAERPPASCLPLVEKTFILCLQDGFYAQALRLVAATRSRELALNLLDVTAEKDKAVFLDLVASDPQLLRPDRVLGAAYKHGHTADVMPYLISELGRLYDAVEELTSRGVLGSLVGWRHKKREEK